MSKVRDATGVYMTSPIIVLLGFLTNHLKDEEKTCLRCFSLYAEDVPWWKVT